VFGVICVGICFLVITGVMAGYYKDYPEIMEGWFNAIQAISSFIQAQQYLDRHCGIFSKSKRIKGLRRPQYNGIMYFVCFYVDDSMFLSLINRFPNPPPSARQIDFPV
jgi:hypothetical protein